MALSATHSLLASYGERAVSRLAAEAWLRPASRAVDEAAARAVGGIFRLFLPAGDAADVARRTVETIHTAAGMTRDRWYATRHAEAVQYLTSRGLDPQRAWWAAVALLGHWAHETGHGRHETDYALGNIRANASWRGLVHLLQGDDDRAPAPYRAYASLREGVADNASLAVDGARYAPAFRALLASWGRGPFVVTSSNRTVAFPMDVVQWYADLTRAGWHPYSEESQATYRGTVTMAAASLLAAQGAAAQGGASTTSGAGRAALAVLGGLGVAAGGYGAWRAVARRR